VILSIFIGWTYISYIPSQEIPDPIVLREGFLIENQAIYALEHNNFLHNKTISIKEASYDYPTFLWIAVIADESVMLDGYILDIATQEIIIPRFYTNSAVVMEIWVETPCELVFYYTLVDQPTGSWLVPFVFQWQVSTWMELYDHLPEMDVAEDTVIYYGEVIPSIG